MSSWKALSQITDDATDWIPKITHVLELFQKKRNQDFSEAGVLNSRKPQHL